jgi:predicted Zn-dependent protease with MMP-like domain
MVSDGHFEEHVRRALDSLPPHISRALENVAVVVAEQDPDDPDLYGVWESHEYLPDKITIFRRPLVAAFPQAAELEEEIRITVLHELAHYFGIDEDRLDELGYA